MTRCSLLEMRCPDDEGDCKIFIARALCDDLAVQTAFPDGILWVTLGKKPELVSAMRNRVQALGRQHKRECADSNRARKNLLVNCSETVGVY